MSDTSSTGTEIKPRRRANKKASTKKTTAKKVSAGKAENDTSVICPRCGADAELLGALPNGSKRYKCNGPYGHVFLVG